MLQFTGPGWPVNSNPVYKNNYESHDSSLAIFLQSVIMQVQVEIRCILVKSNLRLSDM
jgi:hypothetical protein